MATMTVPDTAIPPRSPQDAPHFHRWLTTLPPYCRPPAVPESLLEAFFEACWEERPLGAEDVVERLDCPDEEAFLWERKLQTCLLDPRHYAAQFAAEDARSVWRVQNGRYEEDAHQARQRLAELDEEIAIRKSFAHLGPTQAAEVAEAIEQLDVERVNLLRHLERDVPRVGRMLGEERAAIDAQLAEAMEVVTEAKRALDALAEDTRESMATEALAAVWQTYQLIKSVDDVRADSRYQETRRDEDPRALARDGLPSAKFKLRAIELIRGWR